MRALIFISLLALICGVSACTTTFKQFGRLSPGDTLQALHLLDQNETEAFFALTGVQIEDERVIRCNLVQTIQDHLENRSVFMKIASLCTFQNTLMILGIVFFCGFILYLCKDIIFFMLENLPWEFILKFFTGGSLKIVGILISIWLMAVQFFPFDEYTPFLGLCLFMVSVYFLTRSDIALNLTIFAGAVITLYHSHWFLGTVTIWLLFGRCGFFSRSVTHGYTFGYATRESLLHCLFLGIFLIGSFVGILKFDPVLYDRLEAFQTGVMFWGSFNTLLALLILADFDYNRRHQSQAYFIPMQICMLAGCLMSVYLGTQLNVTSLQNMGGTFLAFWVMDLERTFMKGLGGTLFFLIGCVNFFGLRYLTLTYPEYFIF